MKKITLLFFLLLSFMLVYSQDIVPFKTSKGWQLFDKSSKKLLPEIYQEATPLKGGLIVVNQNDNCGAVNRKGEFIFSLKFDVITQFKNGLIYAKSGNEINLYTEKGKSAISEDFLEISEFKNDSSLLVVKNKAKKYGIITMTGKEILPYSYSYPPEHLSSTYFSVTAVQKFLKVGIEKNDRPLYGLLDKSFNVFIPIKYTNIEQRNDDYLLCHLPGGKYDLYDSGGNLIWNGEYNVTYVTAKFFLIGDDEDKNGIYFRKTNNVEWIDVIINLEGDGHLLCEPYDDEVEKSFIYDEYGKKVVINSREVYHTPNSKKYLKVTIEQSQEDLAESKKMYSLIDFSAREVLKTKQQGIREWTDEFCVIGKTFKDESKQYRQKLGIMSIATGDTIFKLIYDDIRLFKGGFAAMENKIWTFYNYQGTKIGNYNYTEVNPYEKRMLDKKGKPYLYAVKRLTAKTEDRDAQFLYGYVNDYCKEIIPPDYVQIDQLKDRYGNTFSQNYFAASKPDKTLKWNGAYGLLDKNYKSLTAFKYMSIGPYWNSYFIFRGYELIEDEIRGLVGVMDTLGNEIVKPNYDDIELVHSNGFIARKNGKMCFLNKSGKEIIPLKFKHIRFLTDSLLLVTIGDKQGIYDISGKEYIKPDWYKIVEGDLLEKTLVKVKAKSKTDTEQEEDFYVDMQGNQYRE